MKKFLVLCLLALAACSFSATVEVVDGVKWTYYVDGDGVRLETGSFYIGGEHSGPGPCIDWNTAGRVVIPDTLSGRRVVEIGRGAFFKCGEITEVVVPATVTNIGVQAFSGCSKLREVNIPPLVRSLGEDAFSDCAALSGVRLPEGLSVIPRRAFYMCSSLVEIAIPDRVTTVCDDAFRACTRLERVQMGGAMTEVRYGAFAGCESLQAVGFPDSLRVIGDSAFRQCGALETVRLGNGLRQVGNEAFFACHSIRELALPASLTSVGAEAFASEMSISGFTLVPEMSQLGDNAFSGCTFTRPLVIVGRPAEGLEKAFASARVAFVQCERPYGARIRAMFPLTTLMAYLRGREPRVEILSAGPRTSDPGVLDVTYRVDSERPSVRVRALAFENGVRSFANVVRVVDLIDGTAANVGDAVAANVEHRLSWRVSTDWKVDLAKVKFEVLAVEDRLLPVELSTIPATATHRKMQISWNALGEAQVFDALLWLYADGDADLTLTDGRLTSGAAVVADGTTVGGADAVGCVFSRMGFSVLSGDELEYAKKRTRLALTPDGVRQYACRLMD